MTQLGSYTDSYTKKLNYPHNLKSVKLANSAVRLPFRTPHLGMEKKSTSMAALEKKTLNRHRHRIEHVIFCDFSS